MSNVKAKFSARLMQSFTNTVFSSLEIKSAQDFVFVFIGITERQTSQNSSVITYGHNWLILFFTELPYQQNTPPVGVMWGFKTPLFPHITTHHIVDELRKLKCGIPLNPI